MPKLFGAILLIVGAAAVGFSAAAQLTRRVRSLQAMLGALALMERELSFRLTPMPELLEQLAIHAAPPAADFFARCRKGLERLGEQSLGELWREALEAYPMDLGADEIQAIGELGDVLGRYDGEGQQAALARTRLRLEHDLERAEADSLRQGRVYGTLGLTAGAFLVIILL